jgi:hypothetical protein
MTEPQKTFFPWDDIPDLDVLPSGNYHVRGESLEDGEASTGKRMFSCHVVVEEPELYAGMALFENFVTGTDEDPKGIVPGALGTRRLKKMLKAAQVAQSNNVERLCQNFKGTLFGVSVVEYTEQSGEYAGSPRNRITAYWKRGEREPGVALEGRAKGKGPAAAARAASTAAKTPTEAPPPVADVEKPQAQQPPPSFLPGGSPAASTDASADMRSSAAPGTAGPPGASILCPMCAQNVPAQEFAQHVQTCSVQHGEK